MMALIPRRYQVKSYIQTIMFYRNLPAASIFIIAIVIFNFCLGYQTICKEKQSYEVIDLSEETPFPSEKLKFKIQMHPSKITLNKTEDGATLIGNISTIDLHYSSGQILSYGSIGFSFLYPVEHKIQKSQSEHLQMQIHYEIASKSSLPQNKSKSLTLVIIFIVTQYLPEYSLIKLINASIKNKEKVNFSHAIKLIPNLPMSIYKGIQMHQNSTILRLIRREALLISRDEFKQIKRKYLTRYKESITKTSQLYQIKEHILTDSQTQLQL